MVLAVADVDDMAGELPPTIASEDVSGIDPTVSAGTLDDLTQVTLEGRPSSTTALAWSKSEGSGYVEYVPGFWDSRTGTIAKVLASCTVVMVAALGLIFYLHSDRPVQEPQEAVAATESREFIAVLDGKYRIDYDSAAQITDGFRTPLPQGPPHLYAFRSKCTAEGCIAIGTRLPDDDGDHPLPDGGEVGRFRWTDGKWVEDPKRKNDSPCYGYGGVVASTVPITTAWEMSPQPDGALTGMEVDEALGTNECGGGQRYWVPFVMHRVGEVPAGVAIPPLG